MDAIESTNEMQRYLTMWIELDAERRYGTSSEEGDSFKLRILEELCQYGADLNHLEKERGFACLPCVFWCQDLIQFFLDRGSNINLPDDNGDTVLHVAIRNGEYRSSLVKEGVCPENKTKKVVKFLLRHSADPNLTNKRGETPLTVLLRTEANSSNNKRVLKVAKMLVESVIGDPATWKSYGETMLLNGYKNSAIIDYCTKVFVYGNKIDPDARTSSVEYLKTPLMLAAEAGNRKCSRMLINMGANVNAQDLQGFTALHYALTWEWISCPTAKLLIRAGADPNLESASGRNCYDLYDHNKTGCLNISKLGGETTAQEQVKVLEINGAIEILLKGGIKTNINWKRGDCMRMLEQAMDVCREFGLEPSPEFMANYEFLRDNPDPDDDTRREIYDSAMTTVVRLSKGINKLWNVLSFARKDEVADSRHFFDILNYLSEEFKSVEEYASLEQDHFYALLKVVAFFRDWVSNLIRGSNEFVNEGISHLHAITRLTIACFKKLMHATGSKNVLPTSHYNRANYAIFYFNLCCTLAQIHSNLNDVISKKAFNDNKRLLRSLVSLDVRDGNDNSLLHFILENSKYVKTFGSDMIFNLLDFVDDVTPRNFRGFEPVQLIDTNVDFLMNHYPGKLIVKMADAGAHLDTTNAKDGPTLMKVFRLDCEPHLSHRYDSLQCACARVLAHSLVPYVNKVPPKMVHFIRAHEQEQEF